MLAVLNAQLISVAESYRGAGVSNYSLNLLRSLGELAQERATGHRFVAFVNAPGLAIPGVELQHSRLPLHHPLARIAWEQCALPLHAWRRHADLVHGLVNVIPLAARAPGIVTVHDLAFVRTPETLPPAKRAYLTRLCRASMEKAAAIIAVSRQTADDLMALWGVDSRKITVIHNGVADDFTAGEVAAVEEFRRRAGLPERYLFYLGTLEPRKNLELLVSAFARWRRETRPEHRQVKLVLGGGKGWYFERIFTQVKELELMGEVLFPGFIPRVDLPDWYRAAEGFIYPSRFEGFGLPVLEAMACGAPVVCSNAPSLVEVAGDAAIIIPAVDEAALRHALHLLMDQPGLTAELRQRGQDRAAGFSWRKTAQETLAVYEKIVG